MPVVGFSPATEATKTGGPEAEEIGALISELILLLEPENSGKTGKLLSKFPTLEERTNVLAQLQKKYHGFIKDRIIEISREKKKGRLESTAFTEKQIAYKGREAFLLRALFQEYPDTRPDGKTKYEGTVMKNGLWQKKKAAIMMAGRLKSAGVGTSNNIPAAVAAGPSDHVSRSGSPVHGSRSRSANMYSRSGSILPPPPYPYPGENEQQHRSRSRNHHYHHHSNIHQDQNSTSISNSDATNEKLRLAQQVEVLQRLLHQKTLQAETQRQRANEVTGERDYFKSKAQEFMNTQQLQQQLKNLSASQPSSPLNSYSPPHIPLTPPHSLRLPRSSSHHRSPRSSRSSSNIPPPPEHTHATPSYFGYPFGNMAEERVATLGRGKGGKSELFPAPTALNRVFRVGQDSPLRSTGKAGGRSDSSSRSPSGNILRNQHQSNNPLPLTPASSHHSFSHNRVMRSLSNMSAAIASKNHKIGGAGGGAMMKQQTTRTVSPSRTNLDTSRNANNNESLNQKWEQLLENSRKGSNGGLAGRGAGGSATSDQFFSDSSNLSRVNNSDHQNQNITKGTLLRGATNNLIVNQNNRQHRRKMVVL